MPLCLVTLRTWHRLLAHTLSVYIPLFSFEGDRMKRAGSPSYWGMHAGLEGQLGRNGSLKPGSSPFQDSNQLDSFKLEGGEQPR